MKFSVEKNHTFLYPIPKGRKRLSQMIPFDIHTEKLDFWSFQIHTFLQLFVDKKSFVFLRVFESLWQILLLKHLGLNRRQRFLFLKIIH